MAIARELKKQRSGYRPVLNELKAKGFRERLVRNVVAELKRRKQKRADRIRQQTRTSVVVHMPGVLGVMDGMNVKKGLEYVVYRDRGSLTVDADKCDQFMNSADTLRALNYLKEVGRLPLVLGTDNGSSLCAETVEDFCEENQVIHLKSLPRTPQHNGSAENAVREIKDLLKQEIPPEEACIVLNRHRRRRKLGWQTPAEVEMTVPKLCTSDERRQFFEATRAAIKVAVLGTKTAYEKRKAERNAIHETMERFSFITRIRGHRQHG